MKILSSYKDYYDYLQGIYGVDDKIILDRRKNHQPFLIKSSDPHFFTIYFCNKKVDCIYVKGKFLYLDDLIEEYGKTEKSFWDKGKSPYVRVKTYTSYLNVHAEIMDTNMNLKHNCPIMYDRGYEASIGYYPKLSDMNFGSVFKPEEAYQMLVNWLSPKDKESKILSDKEKIISNGFDLKESFRNIK